MKRLEVGRARPLPTLHALSPLLRPTDLTISLRVRASPSDRSQTLPWFGEKGLGTQFETTHSVTWLVEHGYIKRLK